MTQDLQFLKADSGRAYIMSMMDGERGICVLMRSLVAKTGETYAAVPNGTTMNRVEQFKAGGLLSAISAENFLLERIAHYPYAGKSGILLVQDVWAKPEYYASRSSTPNYYVDEGGV